MMRKMTEADCILAIQQRSLFEAEVEGIAQIKIEDYGFFICTAIHDGHLLQKEYQDNCLLSNSERLFEEDPYTGEMIASMPITLIALDSRYAYDLNRPPENCIYEEAWGKPVWKTPLSNEEKQQRLERHALFYRIFDTLVETVETLHGNCLVYDIHSYNHNRIENDTPTFNVGSEQLDTKRWKKVINHWNKQLSNIELPNIETRSAINEVFFGRGYLASFVRQKHRKNTLVLPTEIKKIFMDESNGESFPLVLNDLKSELKNTILSNALYFSKQAQPKTPKLKSHLLSSHIEPDLIKLDTQLYKLCKGIETLNYINPRNLVKEKRRFFSHKYNYTPEFTYRQLRLNPFEFREKLYHLPEQAISDINIQQMYRDVIDSFATKVDLLATIGTDKFLYNSLRYYGEPSSEDMAFAQFLLYAKEYKTPAPATINAKQAKLRFKQALKDYNIDCKVEISSKIIAAAMVDNSKKTIFINKSTLINELQLESLIHHELGVHMVTTINSEKQPLKVFKLGLPGTTYTQEGLAILSEYLTGNLNLQRLKTLALRVIAVKMMVDHHDFSHTFKTLTNNYEMDTDEAFRLTARVYRGGGFTKDFLYLRGFKDAVKLYREKSLMGLYIGKTSFSYLSVINEMTEREMAYAPTHLPMYLQKELSLQEDPILDYLLASS